MSFDKIEKLIRDNFENTDVGNKLIRARQFISRGLDDEKLILDILKNEKKIPKKLPAEMYDKVNYMCRRNMDRIIHFEIDYDFVPDISAFRTVLICLEESSPVLHSRFVDNHIAPYWRVSDYKVDDILSVISTENVDAQRDDFLFNSLDLTGDVQMKIGILIYDGKCKLCITLNHMCMDGGGLKAMLNDLFNSYDSYLKQGTVKLYYEGKSRAYQRIYDDMSDKDRKAAKRLYKNPVASDSHHLPFTDNNINDYKFSVRKKIPATVFEQARLRAKEYNATANDLIAAAYIRAFYEITGCPEKEKVGIACAVDLRRHITHPEKIGYTNHTAFMPCIVEEKGETMKDTLINAANSTARAKSDRFVGLYGLPLLNMSYSTMIYAQAELIIGACYNVSNMSISYLGAMDPAIVSMNGIAPVGMWCGGVTKDKPCGAVNAVAYNGDLMLMTYIKGNEEDRSMLEHFFDLMEKNISSPELLDLPIHT